LPLGLEVGLDYIALLADKQVFAETCPTLIWKREQVIKHGIPYISLSQREAKTLETWRQTRLK